MLIFLRILKEGVVLALQELWSSKLRTFLSILGITIGIFCVISVQVMVDSVERNVRSSFEKLGEDVIYISRFPWGEDPDESWWKYIKRPHPSYQEYQAINEEVQQAKTAGIRVFFRDKNLKYKNNLVEDIPTIALSHEMGEVFNMEVADGRYFSQGESHLGKNVMLIGHTLAEELFLNIDPINKQVRWMGKRMMIIGVLEKEGKSLLGDGFDNMAIIPYNFVRRYEDLGNASRFPLIGVKAKEGVSLDALKDELTGVLRAERKLRPKEKENFALNQLSLLTDILDTVFGVINVAGWIIGIFALLVGGFGIANIMFVSVKERTGIIGIKKSLGAKKHFILFEFLIEAVCLCLIGGLLGIALVSLLSWTGNNFIDSFTLQVTQDNIIQGLIISIIIGVFSGISPALNAANLSPVEAIRQHF